MRSWKFSKSLSSVMFFRKGMSVLIPGFDSSLLRDANSTVSRLKWRTVTVLPMNLRGSWRTPPGQILSISRRFLIGLEVHTSWNLLTLTAKADIVFCQLVMFLTVLFHWMYKMKYSCYQESFVIHGWFVYWILVEKCFACQSRKSDFSFFTLLDAGWKVSSDSGLTW